MAEADLDERRGARPDRAQGQGPRVPGGVPGGLRRAGSRCRAAASPLRLPDALLRGRPARRRRPPPGGAAALLRRHDAREGRAASSPRPPTTATARARKVSRFVVEALDLPSPTRRSRARAGALEALAGISRRRPSRAPAERAARPATTCSCACPTARSTTTRPARSSTATSTTPRAAPHPPPRRLRQRDPQGGAAPLRGAAWPVGPFSRRRPRRRIPRRLGVRGLSLPRARGARLRAGEETLRRFLPGGATAPWNPTGVEQEFAFARSSRNRGAGPLRPRGRER